MPFSSMPAISILTIYLRLVGDIRINTIYSSITNLQLTPIWPSYGFTLTTTLTGPWHIEEIPIFSVYNHTEESSASTDPISFVRIFQDPVRRSFKRIFIPIRQQPFKDSCGWIWLVRTKLLPGLYPIVKRRAKENHSFGTCHFIFRFMFSVSVLVDASVKIVRNAIGCSAGIIVSIWVSRIHSVQIMWLKNFIEHWPTTLCLSSLVELTTRIIFRPDLMWTRGNSKAPSTWQTISRKWWPTMNFI